MKFTDWKECDARHIGEELFAEFQEGLNKTIPEKYYREVMKMLICAYRMGVEKFLPISEKVHKKFDEVKADNVRLCEEYDKLNNLHKSLDEAYGALKEENAELKRGRADDLTVEKCKEYLQRQGYVGSVSRKETIVI